MKRTNSNRPTRGPGQRPALDPRRQPLMRLSAAQSLPHGPRSAPRARSPLGGATLRLAALPLCLDGPEHRGVVGLRRPPLPLSLMRDSRSRFDLQCAFGALRAPGPSQASGRQPKWKDRGVRMPSLPTSNERRSRWAGVASPRRRKANFFRALTGREKTTAVARLASVPVAESRFDAAHVLGLATSLARPQR